ncbi:Uncharacterized protein HZ326_1536 [Fusarium oxysporum f. sp. albedinis]|nr:Uncharacterized protein HZ326_1536 [Fusarium oxysporum f. sp. albedinis]
MSYARPNLPLSQFDLGDVGAAACIGNHGDSNASPSSYRREMASYRGWLFKPHSTPDSHACETVDLVLVSAFSFLRLFSGRVAFFFDTILRPILGEPHVPRLRIFRSWTFSRKDREFDTLASFCLISWLFSRKLTPYRRSLLFFPIFRPFGSVVELSPTSKLADSISAN